MVLVARLEQSAHHCSPRWNSQRFGVHGDSLPPRFVSTSFAHAWGKKQSKDFASTMQSKSSAEESRPKTFAVDRTSLSGKAITLFHSRENARSTPTTLRHCELVDPRGLSPPILQLIPELKLNLPQMSSSTRPGCPQLQVLIDGHCLRDTYQPREDPLQHVGSYRGANELSPSSQVGSSPGAAIPTARSFRYVERLVKYDSVFTLFGRTCKESSSSCCGTKCSMTA